MKFKEGVVWRNFKPDIWLAIVAAAEIYVIYGSELIITSGNDGKHMDGSFHYTDLAFDARTRHLLGSLIPVIGQRLKEELGVNYDVIIEKDHIHVEYDVKS